MLAVVYHGERKISLEERPLPQILEPSDAIVRVVRSTICTSDLHIRNGAVPRAVPGVILGHEFAGEVVEVGAGVKTLKPGDRTAANCESFCGECYFCERGFVNNCEKGGWELGCRIDGCQAEYVRVPFADHCLYRLPDTVSYEDALFVGDILSSGYWGAEIAGIRPGDTVAVIGAGPVGLCAAQSAKYFGAGTVVLIDRDEFRLRTAQDNQLADICINTGNTGEKVPEDPANEGQAAPENPVKEDPVEVVRRLTGGRGADAVIEAAGGEETFRLAWMLARPNAVVSLVAMYEKDQVLPLPSMYGKNLIFKTGGVDAAKCPHLIQLIEKGVLRTDFLITHRGPLEQIMEGYRIFGEKADHCIKWVVTEGTDIPSRAR